MLCWIITMRAFSFELTKEEQHKTFTMRRVAETFFLSASAASAFRVQRLLSSSAVIVTTEPEFEGEQTAGTNNQSSSSTAPKPGDRAPIPQGQKSYDNMAPRLDFKALRMGMQRRARSSDADEVQRVEKAYLEFFNHVRFRNKWAEPPFSEDEVGHAFRESADIVVRIRKFLDASDPSTKLRQLCGDAQKYLHSADSVKHFRQDPRKFIIELVHWTFQDACGYVERLSRSKIDGYIAEIFQYQYNPKAHAQHQLAWINENLVAVRILPERQKDAAVDWSEDAALTRTDEFYCPNKDEEERWRNIIGKLYGVMDEVEVLLKKK